MKKSSAFTLVELSIVLVIIGLIVGGVVGGQSLIASAKLNSVISDVNAIKSSVKTFELQYDAKPGDMVNAYDYWAADCHADEDTCNGNGDNIINGEPEKLMTWAHLTLADIYPGNYTGIFNGDGSWEIGLNAPAATISGAGYSFSHNSNQQVLYLASVGSSGGFGDSALTPADAKLIDKKSDDGKPKSGKISVSGGYDFNNSPQSNPNCISTAGDTTTYDLDYKGISCRLEFLLESGSR